MAAAERRVRAISALTGLLPLGIALLAVVAPLRAEVEQLALTWAPGRTGEVALLGGAALVFGLGLMRALEGVARSGVYRRTLSEFLSAPSDPTPSGGAQPSLRSAEIVFDAVSVRYPGASEPTPAPVELHWAAGQGLAVVGANGSGKSSLVRCVVGLQQPTAGRVRFDGHPADRVDWTCLRRRIAYVPQGAFVAANRSVGWHLRLLGPSDLGDEEMERALDQVGLLASLAGHASGDAPLEVPAAELSGGERQRLHLARALIGDPDLVVLDEPEAGLDGAGRAWLRSFLASLAKRSRVLVVAHDESVVPEGFEALTCRRGGEPTA
ncbi:MAG: ATP-binding cassette domain-containing protein [Deltaproteobacteria bacterium]|jgi:ABC-type bacteriocin/lantibiotic exporter with double-glycine peptidase domain|nr:ATP-binding cassette domain-containing protein [Deltaproteobacteria bacterium]MBW2535405.1 ATP-binding cassette domain-containing protein [Deltaproteobacteria bacterium]